MAVTSGHWLPQSGYGGYIGWGENEAEADFKATGGSGKFTASTTSGPIISPNQSATAMIEDSFARLNQEVSQKFKEFTGANPFKVDEVLKTKKLEAGEQIDPYYDETLSNYLLGVERKISRGQQDTRDLLAELSSQTTSYTEGAKFKLNEAVSRARAGAADVGLFESGGRFRSEGLLGREASSQTEDFLRGQGFKSNLATEGLNRLESDIGLGSLTGHNLKNIKGLNLANATGLGLETAQELRNTERQRFTETETRANELLREAGQKYVAGFQASLPPQYQSNSSFDLLKQIGIYS